jgi:putative ABC transport system permease protein
MVRNFFTTATRRLLKNGSYTLLNVAGLSIGLACFTLIGLWVLDELNYDSFHQKSDRIYRVASTFTDESGQFDQAVTCIPLAPALVNDLPEVENALRIDTNDAIVRQGDKQFSEKGILGVDPSFFDFFSFKLLKGDPATALNEPYNIVLSESMAKKYFGDKDPLGEFLKIFQYDPDGQGVEYKVTGVIEDCPANSHFNYNFLFSFKTIEAAYPNSFGYDGWFNNSHYTYILLKPEASADQLQAKLSTFLEKYIGRDMKKNKIYWSYFLQPLRDIHLKSHLRYEIGPTSSVANVMIFGTIGFVVLLLASINYINLSTAYATDRFKEVGVRKVMGAYKNQLIAQYLVESWILAMVSMTFAIAWLEIARPLFESVTGKEITNLYNGKTIVSLLAVASVVGLLSGTYPSIVLSSLRIVNVLKGQLSPATSGVLLRKSLVVFQYAITIILLTGILVTQMQLRFIGHKDLGYNKDNLLILNVNGSPEVRAGFQKFKNDLLTAPNIGGVATSNAMISGGLSNSIATIEDASGKKINGTIFTNGIDQDYIDTYGMKLVSGRNFIKGSRADSLGVIINEATSRSYGYTDPDGIIGKEFILGGVKGIIIGVVSDFHYSSLHKKIEPTCMFLWQGGFSRIAVRLETNVQRGMEYVVNAWKVHFPNSVLEYSFAEQTLEAQYQSEQRFSKIFLTFSIISLSIACMGLFALVSYSVKSRTKEIGIRKVLGASVSRIVTMLSREFIVLVVIACFIATPLSYYFMQRWLESFVYRTTLGAEIFLASGAIALLMAIVTISIKSVRSALANPVNSLRNE